MKHPIKKVAAVHDISGIGRCSLTVIIPVLSVMKVQVCPLPTVVLSTHMGGFGKPASIELTQGLEKYIEHWKACDTTFDCLYSGYLANEEQITIVKKLFKEFKQSQTCIVVDPVMGDHGKLYSAYDEKMQVCMRELIQYADVITPNLTEAYFLADRPYEDSLLSEIQIKQLIQQLKQCTSADIVIKGVQISDGTRVNIVSKAGEAYYYALPYEEIQVKYPGTGDIFCSVMIGYLLQGKSLEVAVESAATFVKEAVAYTHELQTPTKEGVALEAVLGHLLRE